MRPLLNGGTLARLQRLGIFFLCEIEIEIVLVARATIG
jgi:hypothetical protein